jgi:tetratricopeptide (TPR) repeat protein/predicted Ser/Thr protein kinase
MPAVSELRSSVQGSDDSATLPGSTEDERVPARGDVIGRYVVRGMVGRGAMGVVLEAFDPKLDRKVALKLLHAGASIEGQARLQREAQALARLAHEHVIRVHDVGTYEDRVFIAMELVQGQTLAEWLAGARRRVDEVVRVLSAAGQGLAAAHAAGLVHRDFKPSNVLLGDDGRVKVTDFGLARAQARAEVPEDAEASSIDGTPSLHSARVEATLTRTGALVGTPAYMAPEQFDGRAVDPRSDQFSFCVALYEALAGKRPFGGSTPWKIAGSIAAQRFAAPLPSTSPRALRQAVRRGLRVDPAERHPDMHSLLRALAPAHGARRRRAAWVVAAAMVGSGAWWAARAEPPVADDYCAEVAERLVGVWDDAQRERGQQAFEATGLSYAADTWVRTRARLDAQASAWVDAQRQVCEATAALERAGASEAADLHEIAAQREAIDRQMVCLHRRFAELRRLGELLATADAALVERAPQAVEALGSIEACANAEPGPGPEPGPAVDHGQAALARVEALAEVEVLQEAGRYDDAVTAAQAAVAAMDETSRGEQAEALLALAMAEESAARADDAEQHFHAAFSSAAASGRDEVALHAALGLATVISKAAHPRFEEAERWTEHADAALDRLGRMPEHVARIEGARGRIDFERGDYEAARQHFERALQVRTQELGPDDHRLASHHNNLGHAYAALERQADAIEHERRALELERAHYGQEHPRVGAALSMLCSSYSDAGQLDAAISTGTEAVAMLRKTLSKDHPSLGTALVNLGSAQSRAGQPAEAERSFLEALENAKAAYGERHRRVGLALNNLGVHHELTGQLGQAEGYHRQAAEMFVATLGPAHPTTAIVESNLASVLVKEDKLDEAEVVLRGSLRTLEEQLGVDHPDVAIPMALLGQVLMDRGRAAEALPLLERVHVLWQPGQAPPENVAAVLFALGSALWEAGEDRKRGIELVTRSHGHYRQLGDARPEEVEETAAWLRERGVRVE